MIVLLNKCYRTKNFILLLFLLLFSGCKNEGKTSEKNESKEATEETVQGIIDNAAIYHWKTTFDLTEEDYKFLQEYNITKLYLRCFDVDIIYHSSEGDKSVEPIATTIFRGEDYKGDAQIIPTVYVTINALREVKNVDAFGGLIVERTLAMVRHNKLGEIREMQIDCDWTKQTEEKFFKLCKAMKTRLERYDLELSATIRLHQLSQTPPPVDRGMLMIYNTGNFKDSKTNNSILDFADVQPYLSKSIRYDIPLDIALPVFSWGIWFRNNQFKSIISDPNLTISEIEKEEESNNWYIAVEEHYQGGNLIKKDDRIRLETPSLSTILNVKRVALKNIRQEGNFTLSLYHLDLEELRKYKKDEIREIYSN